MSDASRPSASSDGPIADSPWSILEAVDSGIAVTQPDGTVVFASRLLSDITGTPIPAIVGSTVFALFDSEARTELEQLHAAALVRSVPQHTDARGPAGEAIRFSATLVLRRADQFREPLVVWTVRVLEKTVQEQRPRIDGEAAEVSQSLLDIALRGTEVGLWDWDIAADNLTWITNWCEQWGLTEFAGSGHERLWTERMHPDDLPGYRAALESHLVDTTRVFDVEYRLRDQHDDWVWIQERGRIIERDAMGRGVRMVGFCLYIDGRHRTAQALARSESRFELALWGTEVAFWDLNAVTDEIHWWNDWCASINVDPCEGLEHSRRWNEQIHPDDFPFNTSYEALLEGSAAVYEAEYRLRTRNGGWRWVLDRGRATARDGSGRALRIAGVTIDIDARKRTELALRESEGRLETAVWGTEIGLWESDQDGGYAWFDDWNDRFDIEECRGPDQDRRWRERIHPEDAIRYARLADAAARGLIDHYVVEYRILTRSGTWRWLHERGKVSARDASGNAQHYVGLCMCVDERKTLEAALRAAKNHYELAISGAQLPVWEYDVRSDTVTGNAYWHRTVGYDLTDDEALRRIETWLSDIHPDDVERQRKLFTHEATDRAGFYQTEFRIRLPGGEYKWLLGRGRVVERSEDGTPARVAGIALDIDAQKRVEMELRESEQRFRGAFEFAAIGMALVAPDGRWLRVNRSLCEIIGYTAEELLATNFQSITHPDDLDTDVAQMRQMLDGSLSHYDMEKRYLHKDGRIVWVLLSVSLVHDAVGRPLYFVGQIHDITEERRLTSDLLLARADLQAILDYAPARITSWHADWTNRFINRVAAAQFGISAPEAVGKHAREILGEERYRIAKPYMAAVLSGEPQSYEQVDLQPDGSQRYSHVKYVPHFKDGRVIAIYALGSDVTELRESRQRIRELAQRLETVREDERQSIAQVLHEGIAQDLFAMSLGLKHLQAQSTSRAGVTQTCQELAEAIDKCMTATREIANELRPPAFAYLPVSAALEEHARHFGDISGLTIRVAEIAPLPKLDEAARLILFRAGQEALTNVARHARASSVDIVLRSDSDTITMDITDDGVGIEDAALAKAGALGLLGIHERVGALGGALVVRKNGEAGYHSVCAHSPVWEVGRLTSQPRNGSGSHRRRTRLSTMNSHLVNEEEEVPCKLRATSRFRSSQVVISLSVRRPCPTIMAGVRR